MDYQLGIIGAGNMAEAMLRGVLDSNFLPHGSILAAEPRFERRQMLTHELSVSCTDDNPAAAACPRVVLAVKPQMMGEVLDEIAPAIRDEALVISIAAGVTAGWIDQRLGGRGRLVRVMPNTPMLVGAGISAVAAGPRATAADVEWTSRLVSAGGGSAVTVEESLMDAVTAVSGSGPAYLFYLVEAMIAAGVAEGLSLDVATRLARETCLGAGKLLAVTGEPPEGLRARVTSPGGTTQRAIETLDAAGVKNSLIAAVRAAAARSRELGN